MQFETALLIGVFYFVGVYLLLGRNFINILFGVVVLSNGANLFVLSMSGSPDDRRAPIISEGVGAIADPLPQALVLTAIVIGFGLTIYLIMLLYRIFLDSKTTNSETLFATQSDDE